MSDLRRHPARRSSTVALICALATLLGACADVPARTSPVVIGKAPAGGAAVGDIYAQQPKAPRPGWSPDTIVRNYISALATDDPTQSVARQYLTPAAAEKWVPGNLVTIIATSSVQPGDTDDSVNLTYSRIARVAADGVYQPDPLTVPYQIRLAKVSGEWRIENPPDGLLLTAANFATIYSPANLYFLNSTETKVVPDLRYFPKNLEQRANTLIQGLLNGPSGSLEGAVRNELADPVDLQSNVVYSVGEVQVRLKGVVQKNVNQISALSAQIVLTLADISPSAVRITNDGQPLEVPGGGVTQTALDWENFDSSSYPAEASEYFLRDGAVLNSDANPIPGSAGNGSLDLTAAAISVDSSRLAAVSAGPGAPALYQGAVGAAMQKVMLPRTSTLSDPTWGPSSEEFWVVRNGDQVIRVPKKGSPTVVGPTSLASLGRVKVMRLSLDGIRVAFLIAQGATSRLYLASIVRDANGIVLSDLVPLAADLDVLDFSWRDPRQIVLFSRSSATDVSAYSLLIDDSERDPIAVPVLGSLPTAIAAAKDRPLLCAGEGAILRLDDSNWVPLITGRRVSGSKPFYPG